MIAEVGWRGVVVTIMGFGAIPLTLLNPYFGLLAYCVLSFVRPAQTLTWSGDVSMVRFTFFVGVALVFRTLMSPRPWFRLRAPTWMFVGLWGWIAVATMYSPHAASSGEFLERFSKISIAVLLVTGLVHTRIQLKWLMIVLALCPGFYALKLGIYFLSGNDVTHHGGPDGMDNNDIAMFIAMGFPLLVYGAAEVWRTWLRWTMYGAALLCIPAVIVGDSRGGILAISASVFLTVWRRFGWLKAVVPLVVLVVVVMSITPQATLDRWMTMREPEGDSSSMGRLYAWRVAALMAMDNPVTGVGMGEDAFKAEYPNYQVHPAPKDWPHVAHSIWFSVMAGAGFPGLILFILTLAAGLWITWRVRHQARRDLGDEDGHWAISYATGIETSIIAYMIAGTFLSQVGFEFAYAIIVLGVPVQAMLQAQVAGRDAEDLAAVSIEAEKAMAPA